MLNILIINPRTPGKYIHRNRGGLDRIIAPLLRYSLDKDFSFKKDEVYSLLPPITLFGLQALFEKLPGVNVEIIDEQVHTIDFSGNHDIACITATTLQFNRAKDISNIFRENGVTTIIGGMHSTALPDDCIDHFDVVCTGEAETYVADIAHDYLNNKLKKLYSPKYDVEMEEVPFYNYKIGKGPYLPVHVITFSRGCLFSCEYCSIGNQFSKYRCRSIESITNEISRVKAKLLWFPDATLSGNIKKAQYLLESLQGSGIRWISQMTSNIVKQDSLLDLMKDSGCLSVSIGFETLNKENLLSANKKQNTIDDYHLLIEKLHDRGIAVEGNFVFGFDQDKEDVFERTSKFIIDSQIDLPQIFVLTPYPGTPLFSRLKAENRIVDFNWAHYDNMHFRHLPVFKPQSMSREQLMEGCAHVEKEVFSIKNTIKRIRGISLDQIPIIIGNYILSSRIRDQGSSDLDVDDHFEKQFINGDRLLADAARS